MDSERKEFERWFEGHCLPCESNWFERDADGDYTFNPTAHAWEGWQARAELGEGTPHCTEKLNALHTNYIALQAEFTACYSSLVSQEEKNAALQAECEALRLKAARYDWLREQDGLCLEMLMDKCFTCTDVDEAIDAAMGAMGKEKA
jgi:hypothetical protein